MVITNIKASFPNDIKTIWNIVTSLDNYTWRSDLSKLVIQQLLRLPVLDPTSVMNSVWKTVI